MNKTKNWIRYFARDKAKQAENSVLVVGHWKKRKTRLDS